MATLLYRLGRFAYRHAVRVLIAWVLIAAAALGAGIGLGGQLQDSYAIPGTESQKAIDLLAAVFPQTAGASAEVVVQDRHGTNLKTADGPTIEKVVTALDHVQGVEQAVSPYGRYATSAVSKDGSTVIIAVQFTTSSEKVTATELAAVKKATAPLTDAGLTVEFGGQVYQNTKVGLSLTEGLGVLFAALVLIVTFGSLLAAGLPLISAIAALAVSMGAVLTTASFVTLSSTTPLLALMIGLAVGIDYALFILSRHRAQLAAGMDPGESAATAVATAGSSVIFAGVTVMIALIGLLIVGIPFLGLMGIAAAIAVLLAMLAATTLLPAIMGLLGARLAPKPGSRTARRALATAAASSHDPHDATAGVAGADVAGTRPRSARPKSALGQRWVALVLKAPVVAIIAVLAVLGTLAVPAFSLALALPDGGSQPSDTTARKAYDIVSTEFGPGRNGPLIITVDITQSTTFMTDLTSIGNEIARLPGVDTVSSGTPNATLDTAIIQVIPTTGPSDPKTTQLVERIRALEPSIASTYHTPIAVTGATAVAIDVSSRLDSALLPFGIIVVGLSVILLMVVFRSLLVPLKAAIGYLLSVLAAFGVVVAVFQWGWGASALGVVPGPILSFMPVLLMAILFGLAMDYEVFLVSGMREAYVHGVAQLPAGATRKARNAVARRAIVSGFSGAARVVTAAALIMFFVFAAFVPEGAGVIKVIALGLAAGVFVDAFLVRMTLVPAVMALAGRSAWYLPRWLSRILPNVDIEGEGLRAHQDAAVWALERFADGEAISLDRLMVGAGNGPEAGPIGLRVPSGTIALVSDETATRRLVAATIAGRLEPRGGRAQVGGHPLPSDAAKVARLVALADLAGPERPGVSVTLGELLEEHLRLTSPWYLAPIAARRARLRAGRVSGALQGLGRQTVSVDATTPIETLPRLERAVAMAVVALSERAAVVLLDSLDPFSDPLDALAFLRALDRLAPATTTVVVGMPGLNDVADAAPPRVRAFDLAPEYNAIEEGALR
ncbi:MMPL family transporter [Lysinimonas soli]|uniref:MMPL family transporter n=1 Tax=Lysinimonas soli TaxID=1074233 RepID=A0ABW0NSC2_9MICO